MVIYMQIIREIIDKNPTYSLLEVTITPKSPWKVA